MGMITIVSLKTENISKILPRLDINEACKGRAIIDINKGRALSLLKWLFLKNRN